MTNLYTLNNQIVGNDNILISNLEAGGPVGDIVFTYSADVDTRNLTITPSSFPDNTTHWFAIIQYENKSFTLPREGVVEATTDPENIGNPFDYIIGDPDTIFIRLVPVNDGAVGTLGRKTLIVYPPEGEDISLEESPTLSGQNVNDTIQRTDPVYNVIPASSIRVLQFSSDDIEYNDVEDISTIPSEYEGGYLRDHYTVTGTSGNIITFTSNSIGPITEGAGEEDPFQIVAEDVTIVGSYYDCGTSAPNGWFRPLFTLSERISPVEGEDGATVRIRATTTRPDLYPNDGPDIHWSGAVVPAPDHPGLYTIVQTDPPGLHCELSPRQDFWLFSEPNVPTRQRIRLSQQPVASDPDEDAWSPISTDYPVAWFVPVPEDDLPDPEALNWRIGPLLRSAAMWGVTPDNPSLDPFGIYPSEGYQWMPGEGSWSADGMKFLVGQDASQLILSVDQGMTCYRPLSQGLPLLQICSVKWDPDNNNRAFVVAGSSSLQVSSKHGLGGIYVTTDNCNSFQRVHTIATAGRAQNNQDAITVHPATGGPGSTWYCASNVYDSSFSPVAGTVVRSQNNGATWTSRASLAWATYRRIYKLQVAPSNVNTLYMATETGFWRSTDGAATWSRDWNGNLPSNQPVSSFILDPDNADHIICCVRPVNTATNPITNPTTTANNAKGVWETTNGGTTWTRIRDVWAHHVSWSAKNGSNQRTLYVLPRFTNHPSDGPHIRTFAGTWKTRFTTPGISASFRGSQSNAWPFDSFTWDGGSTMHMTNIVPHPTDPTMAIWHCKTPFLRTETSGDDWVLAFGGYGGLNWRGYFNDPANINTVVASLHDAGIEQTTNALDIITLTGFSQPVKNRVASVLNSNPNTITSSFTGRGIVKLPNSGLLPAAWRNRIIVGAGGSSSAVGCLLYLNDGSSTWQDWLGSNPTLGQSNSQGGGGGVRSNFGYLFHNPRKVWAGANRIDLQTQSNWTTTSRWFAGAAQDLTDTVYGFNGGTTTTIERSTNFGASWTPLYTFPAAVTRVGFILGTVNTGDGRLMAFYNYLSRNLYVLRDNNGTPSVSTFNLTSLFNSLSPLPSDAFIDSVGWDPLDFRYIYIGTGVMGNGHKWFRGKFTNESYNSIDWEDITSNSYANGHGTDIFMNHHTGDLQINTNGGGAYMFPAPDDWKPRVGSFYFTGQPSNGNTLTVNGQTVTFVTSGATELQVNIGGNLSTTMNNLATVLNASANSSITPCTYIARWGNRVDVHMDDPRVNVTETFPLTSSAPNATVGSVRTPCKRYYWLRRPLIGQPT